MSLQDHGIDSGAPGGVLTDPMQAVNSMQPGGDQQPGEQPFDPEEEKLVEKLWKCFERGRKFDENFRKQIAIDRRYAAGTSDLSWAVTTNLIGAFIDILVALLYARNPDVSVKKASQVDNSGTTELDAFAETLEIVISTLWKNGSLKRAARKAVRSVLSTGEGWLKVNLLSEKVPQPETDKALNDTRETMARIEAQIKLLEDPEDKDPETLEAELAEKQALIADLEQKIELSVNKFLAIDFVRTERIQVSLDVESIEDYKNADWIADESYVLEEDALERFPRLSAEDIKMAKKYYQNQPKELATRELDAAYPQNTLTAESAQAFSGNQGQAESPPNLHIVELWDRRDKHIRTMIEGVKKWAKEPYTPPYPTKRFFPYFYFAFYEVDGLRHAQSLSWRLYKLQDEYSSVRSNYRLTRERSIPGILFNATMLDDHEAEKLQKSKHQEYTALRPTNADQPLANLFAPKPVQGIDPRLYDPTYILADMERLSGVQEALSSVTQGPGNPITATEANIQQAGTSARTTCDRDNIEEMLTDLACYTAEQALQCMTMQEVQRMAGKKAFWPEDMDINDLFTLVEVKIEAGTTGKPALPADQQAWGTLFPMIKQTIAEIRQALSTGDMATANVLIELIKETMKRLGDETDPDRFIPRVPPPGTPGAGAPPPPIVPKVSVALKGEIDGNTALKLVQPAVDLDNPPPPESQSSPEAPGAQAGKAFAPSPPAPEQTVSPQGPTP